PLRLPPTLATIVTFGDVLGAARAAEHSDLPFEERRVGGSREVQADIGPMGHGYRMDAYRERSIYCPDSPHYRRLFAIWQVARAPAIGFEWMYHVSSRLRRGSARGLAD